MIVFIVRNLYLHIGRNMKKLHFLKIFLEKKYFICTTITSLINKYFVNEMILIIYCVPFHYQSVLILLVIVVTLPIAEFKVKFSDTVSL